MRRLIASVYLVTSKDIRSSLASTLRHRREKSYSKTEKKITPYALSSISLAEAHARNKDFVIRIQQAWDDGFVHGDINRRNIFCDGNGLGLDDFEPYLEVIQNGRFRLQATKPYVCPVDLKNKKISRSTDEIGLACFLHWFCFDRKISPAKFCQKILLPKERNVNKKKYCLPSSDHYLVNKSGPRW